MKVHIVVFDGFDELDAIAPFEVLQNAAELGANLAVELVALGDPLAVRASHGLSIVADAKLDVTQPPEVLIVPGGGWNNKAAKGAWAEAQSGELPAAIAQLHEVGTLVAGVCTGGMLLAAAGLTKGRPAVTHHGAIAELAEMGVEIVNARVVDDGDLVTAGGVTSGIDLALWLVERFFGSKIALAIEDELEYERRGTVWHR